MARAVNREVPIPGPRKAPSREVEIAAVRMLAAGVVAVAAGTISNRIGPTAIVRAPPATPIHATAPPALKTRVLGKAFLPLLRHPKLFRGRRARTSILAMKTSMTTT